MAPPSRLPKTVGYWDPRPDRRGRHQLTSTVPGLEPPDFFLWGLTWHNRDLLQWQTEELGVQGCALSGYQRNLLEGMREVTQTANLFGE